MNDVRVDELLVVCHSSTRRREREGAPTREREQRGVTSSPLGLGGGNQVSPVSGCGFDLDVHTHTQSGPSFSKWRCLLSNGERMNGHEPNLSNTAHTQTLRAALASSLDICIPVSQRT